MIIRRLAEDLKSHNWTTVAVEIFVLTIGVFLGLQAENWNQSRKDRSELEGYVQRLSRDFGAIRDRSRQLVSEIDRELEALVKISELTHGNGMDSDVDYTALIDELRSYGVAPPRAASYLDILESSNLGLFQDRSIADALIRCDDSMQITLSAHETRRQYLREHGELFVDLFFDVEDLTFEDAIQLADIETHGFRRELTSHRLFRQVDRAGFEAIVDCSTEIVEKLSAGN